MEKNDAKQGAELLVHFTMFAGIKYKKPRTGWYMIIGIINTEISPQGRRLKLHTKS